MAAALRVLLVDDEPLLVDAVGRLLRRAGLEVAEAEDGLVALERLRDGPVDVILSDVRMPRLDGPGLLAALRASGDQTPLVFLTGYGDYGDQELLERGAAAVLGKPAPLRKLLDALQAAARP